MMIVHNRAQKEDARERDQSYRAPLDDDVEEEEPPPPLLLFDFFFLLFFDFTFNSVFSTSTTLFLIETSPNSKSSMNPSGIRFTCLGSMNGIHSSGGFTILENCENSPDATEGSFAGRINFIPLHCFKYLSPLRLLHFAHAVVKFVQDHSPPFEAGTMWSMVKSSFAPQYVHA